MSIDQILTPPPETIPDKDTQSQVDFDAAADEYAEWQTTRFHPQLVTWTGQANTLKGIMNGYKEDAQTALGAAEAQVGLAAQQVNLAADQVSLAAGQVSLAADQVTLAETAANNAFLSANATIYDEAEIYSASKVVFDPLDKYMAYTSQADENQGHQPGTDDGTWWKPTIRPVSTYDYDNRGDLRYLTPKNQEIAIIDGLGLFVYNLGSDEPDDDESCFATTGGRWLLEAAHWDLIEAWRIPNEDYEADFLIGSVTCAITAVSTITSASFSGTILGAVPGDTVIVTPPAMLGATAADTGKLSYHAVVTAIDTVTVYLTNASASTATTNTAIRTAAWPCRIIKQEM